MKNVIAVACMLAPLFLAPVHAADIAPGNELDSKFSVTDLSSADEFAARAAQIDKIVKTGKQFDENVALVNQVTDAGHVSVALITQAGHGNFAAINQDARGNPAVAVVYQSGNGARAVISQR